MAAPSAEIQVIATHEKVIFDLQSRLYDTEGHLHRDHALAELSLSTAERLRDLLAEAIIAASDVEAHQPALWSETALRALASRSRRVAA